MLSPQEKDLLVKAVRKHREKYAQKRQSQQVDRTPPPVQR